MSVLVDSIDRSEVIQVRDESKSISKGNNNNRSRKDEQLDAASTNVASSSSTVAELRLALAAQGIDPRGNKRTVLRKLQKKRAKARERQQQQGGSDLVDETTCKPAQDGHIRTQDHRLQQGAAVEECREMKGRNGVEQGQSNPDGWTPRYDTYLVLDVEATCIDSKNGSFDYPNEIIEMPVVMLQWAEGSQGLEIKDIFHTYVKPTWRPTLSTFCQNLTGIEQTQVDAAPTFSEACDNLFQFLRKHDLLKGGGEDESNARLRKGVVWATHGPFDLLHFVVKQAFISKMRGGPPQFLRGPLLDVRKAVPKALDLVGQKSDCEKGAIDEKFPTAQADDSLSESMSKLAVKEREGKEQEGNAKEKGSGLGSIVSSSLGQLSSSLGSLFGSSEPSTSGTEVTKEEGGIEDESKPAREGPSIKESKKVIKKREWQDRTILGLLAQLSLGEFEGRQHCGLDDTKNVARIVCALAKLVVDTHNDPHETATRKVEVATLALAPNTGCNKAVERRWDWMGNKLGKIIWVDQEEASRVTNGQ